VTRIIGLAGWSGAGKTTLIRAVIPALRARGLSVSTVKHAHHAFDIDQPGKDSHVHREAGASEVLIASSRRFALIHELRDEPEPPLAALLRRLSPVDLVLVEGFKRDRHPKLEIYRKASGKDYLFPADPFIEAIATDAPGPFPIPRLDMDAIGDIADWIIERAQPVERVLGQAVVKRRGAAPPRPRSASRSRR
jgi:molybdopterin-guanine dinucleotide biosynthesis adapter protein